MTPMRGMYLSQLKLTNFRAFRQLELHLSPGATVILGANAQGKTTILEAIYLLAIAKAFRAENEREVINWKAAAEGGQALIDGTISKDDSLTRVIVGYQAVRTAPLSHGGSPSAGPDYHARKEIRIGGVKRTSAELVGLLNGVLFSADDINLIQGPPNLRRRYLDIFISQASNPYLKSLQRYQRILHQRNQLLRLVQEQRSKEEELEFWDRELANEGVYICRQRGLAMTSIAATARQTLLDLAGPGEDLRVDYRPSIRLDDETQQPESQMLTALETSRRRDLVLGSTTVGPHRDDFKLMVNGVDMATYSSRGQARTLALTLRLSEASYLVSSKGESLVLLDDVLSELDAQRRQQVLKRALEYSQTIITATDTGPFQKDFLARASILQIKDGSVEQIARPSQ